MKNLRPFSRKHWRILAIVAIGWMAALHHTQGAIAQTEEADEQPAIIKVNGSGKASLKPDIALVTIGVLRQDKTARAALDANNQAMAAVIDAMKKMKIASKDLQTSGFNISPQYHYPKRSNDGSQQPPVITGYQVSNQLTIRIRDLAKVGNVLDKAVTLGVNSGGGIVFTNDKPEDAITQARKKAMANAIAKARTLTKAAGVELGDIVTITEQSAMPRPVPMARGRMMAEAAMADSVPVQAGENEYRVDISVSWEIAQ